MDDWAAHGPTAAVAGGAFWLIYAIVKKFLDKTAYELRRLGEKIDTVRDKTFEVHTEMKIRRQGDG